MGIFKNIFKNYEVKKATSKINANALKLAKKLKSILVSIGWINYPIELNGEKFVVREIRDITKIHYYIAILDKYDKEFYFDVDKPITLYSYIHECNINFFPTSFLANKTFLEHASGIFNEVKTIQKNHVKECSNILNRVKYL